MHLVNIYQEKQIYVWFRLMVDGSDLGFDAPRAHKVIGDEPSWMEEYRDCGVETALDVHRGRENGGVLLWALEQGIAPGQRFWICVREPTWVEGSYEYPDEYDIEWDAEVVYREPWSDKRAATALEKATKDIREHNEAMSAFHEAEKHIQRTDVSSMFLQSEPYFTPDQYYDDMCPPAGIRCYLRTSATTRTKRKDCGLPWATATLASGSDPNGDWARALEITVENARKALPELAHVDFRALPRRG